MTTLTQGTLIIYASVNGDDPWHPLIAEEVPEWVKSPDTLGRMVAGEMCCNAAEGDKGSLWYRAERMSA